MDKSEGRERESPPLINRGMSAVNWLNVVFVIFILVAIAVSLERSTRGFIIK